MKFRILLVDDTQSMLTLTKDFLEKHDFEVDTALSGTIALEHFRHAKSPYALVILDYLMNGMNGAETAGRILEINPNQFILIYSNDDSRCALKNTWKAGVVEFLDKSAHPADVLDTVSKWCRKYKETFHTVGVSEESDTSKLISSIGLIGVSASMAKIAQLVLRMRNNDSTVLITGESGTGKELVAKALHGKSMETFFPVNCAAFNQNAELLESELFGHEKGAFTGAEREKKGIFEIAGKGTVFLDEIHTLSLPAQQKLLRVLEEKKLRRVGGNREIPIHFRLVVASKPDLEQRMKANTFLPDLYYRINVLRLKIPALRERREDISSLLSHFAKVKAWENSAPKQFYYRTLKYLEEYGWPGNVRELENTVEQLSRTVDDLKIAPEHLESKFFESDPIREERDMDKISDQELLSVYKTSRSMREAARKAGMAHSTFYDRLRKLGIKLRSGRIV